MRYLPIQDQRARRETIARLTTKWMLPRFDDKGVWRREDVDQGMRELTWMAQAFLCEGSEAAVRMANLVLQRGLPEYRFCHFLPFLCLQTFEHFEALLAPDTIRRMDEYVLRHIDEFAQPELDFVGANDNFPCMSTACMVLAGQRYGRADFLEKAKERLRQLLDMLDRRGFTAEYTSPTYTPVQALALAEIANFARDDGVRDMAMRAEARVWFDLLAHMHWPTAQLAGAFSRGYAVDAVGCSHHARFLYYMIYGDELTVNPLDTVLGGERVQAGSVVHHDDDFLKISLMWQSMAAYHCPAALADWARSRKGSFVVSGTSEMLASRDQVFPFLPPPSAPLPAYIEYPERVNFQYTYMTDEYALGTTRHPFHNGVQSHVLRLLYRRSDVVSHQRDVGTMFTRYVVNDDMAFNHPSEFFDMGTAVCLQRENAAMALYAPRMTHDAGISSLKLTVNFARLFVDPDEVWIGERRLVMGEGSSARDEPVYIRDGDVYVCLTPLNLARPDGKTRVAVRRVEKLLEVAFIGYAGRARTFAREDLMGYANGVYVEVRSRAQARSFEDFRAATKPVVQDRWFGDMRKCRIDTDRGSMELEVAHRTQSVRFAAVDGKLAQEPRLWCSAEVPGVDLG